MKAIAENICSRGKHGIQYVRRRIPAAIRVAYTAERIAKLDDGQLKGIARFCVRQVLLANDQRRQPGLVRVRSSVAQASLTPFSVSSPGTRANSSRLWVTRVSPSLRARAAMCRSLTPIGQPAFSNALRMAP